MGTFRINKQIGWVKMRERICKYCYQFKADHAASHYTSWGWCREHNKFVNDYWGCPDFKTWQTAIEDGTIKPLQPSLLGRKSLQGEKE